MPMCMLNGIGILHHTPQTCNANCLHGKILKLINLVYMKSNTFISFLKRAIVQKKYDRALKSESQSNHTKSKTAKVILLYPKNMLQKNQAKIIALF